MIKSIPLVSFIVPIYNVDQYLHECLDSLLKQTYQSIEILCINDYSSDRSLEIIEQYANKDQRIILINFDSNKGAGAARNAGIKRATGKYLRMVDPDDFIPKNSTEIMVKTAEDHKSNFVMGGICYCSPHGMKIKKSHYYPKEKKINVSLKSEKILWHFPFHVSFLFKKRIIDENSILNSEGLNFQEDLSFLIDLSPYMNNVTLINNTVYYYRIRSKSASRTKRNLYFYKKTFENYLHFYNKLSSGYNNNIAKAFLASRLYVQIPDNILLSIPENLNKGDSIKALYYARIFFIKTDIKSICHDNNHNIWGKHFFFSQFIKNISNQFDSSSLDSTYVTLVRENSRKKRHFTRQRKLIGHMRSMLSFHSQIFLNKLLNLTAGNKQP